MKQLMDDYVSHGGLSKEDALKAATRAVSTKYDYAKRIIQTLRLCELAKDEGIIDKLKLDSDDIEFSVLATGLSYAGIVDYLKENPAQDLDHGNDFTLQNISLEKLQDVIDWLFPEEMNQVRNAFLIRANLAHFQKSCKIRKL